MSEIDRVVILDDGVCAVFVAISLGYGAVQGYDARKPNQRGPEYHTELIAGAPSTPSLFRCVWGVSVSCLGDIKSWVKSFWNFYWVVFIVSVLRDSLIQLRVLCVHWVSQVESWGTRLIINYPRLFCTLRFKWPQAYTQCSSIIHVDACVFLCRHGTPWCDSLRCPFEKVRARVPAGLRIAERCFSGFLRVPVHKSMSRQFF